MDFGARNSWDGDCGPWLAERELCLGEGPKLGGVLSLQYSEINTPGRAIVAPKILYGLEIVGNTSYRFF